MTTSLPTVTGIAVALIICGAVLVAYATPIVATIDGLIIGALGFLAVFGERVSDQRRAQQRRDRYDARISAETDPGRRAAWRTIRDNEGEL